MNIHFLWLWMWKCYLPDFRLTMYQILIAFPIDHTSLVLGNLLTFCILFNIIVYKTQHVMYLDHSLTNKLTLSTTSLTHYLNHSLALSLFLTDRWQNQTVSIIGHLNLLWWLPEHCLKDCSKRFYLNMPPCCWKG